MNRINELPDPVPLRLHHIVALSIGFHMLGNGEGMDWEQQFREVHEIIGYSPEYIKNSTSLRKLLFSNPDSRFIVVDGLDLFCNGYNRQEPLCSDPNIKTRDDDYRGKLGLQIGEIYQIKKIFEIYPTIKKRYDL